MTEYDLVKIFKALADKTRQEILDMLGADEKSVNDICAEFNISQPTISHHLHILKNCDLVDYRKQGKHIYYYVRREIINDVFGNVIRKMRIDIVRDGEKEK
ncbi:MAG: metalloregulator ArsR/SmtB family transcription factor [Candidatus Omnitrophica bacterium]|nr:metalloregulator ArsR/SmtB family transcription factor [Candidatus Omnitrophota bacterium]MDD5487537.1 metalloregulator ArsR/SmtB family transcription factor [Candidatus Omnitrophota bacterium]